MIDLTARDEAGPFGNPDGARADLEEVTTGFIEVPSHATAGSGGTRAADATARVIVGKLGAGKTFYLRRLQSYQAKQQSVYADAPQQSLPSTELIVRVCQWFPEQFLTEKWMRLWECAILRSLATHMLRHPGLAVHLDPSIRGSLERDYGKLLGDARRPRSIYSQLSSIINEAHSGNALTRYLDSDRWADLEYDIGEALQDCPPIFFYLDSVDDNFHSAPTYWLRCQLGLFYQTMRLLRDSKLGGRLHLVVCLRDVVMSSVYKSEHAPRFFGEPHIRILDWSLDGLEYVLRRKIRDLPRKFRMTHDDGADTVASWLGATWVHNERRGTDELLEDYLIRHTRLIPRDIVSMGNALCHEIAKQKAAGRAEFEPEALRKVVSDSARRFGNSQITQCANHIAADLMPAHAEIKGYSSAFIGSQQYTIGLAQQLKALLKEVGKDCFDKSALQSLSARADAELGGDCHLPTVLWHNGLLGYTQSTTTRFYSLGSADTFEIPLDADAYVFHPCVIDAVPGVRSVGPRPIAPFDRGGVPS